MSFSKSITRAPRPFQPEIGAEVAALFVDMPSRFQQLVEGTAGCSPYLAGLLMKEQEWISRLAEMDATDLREEVLEGVKQQTGSDPGAVYRQAKRRMALLAGLADLGGVWALEQVTTALTDLADTCIDHALMSLVAAEIGRGKLPGLKEEDAETAGGMAVLAMGKMGAGELNYSSDIDLICLFDETRFDPDEYMDARMAFVRITRRLTALLNDVTAEGYVFRTDLRLRPDASVTPVCIPMEAAERYYESVGRTWERAAFIKARCCAGDLAAGNAFLKRLTPFVWRKHLDFAAIQDAHDMRLRIRDHKGLGGKLTLEGHNMKLGQGGIREIEFFTQTGQIIAGGRDPSLRVRGTVEGLSLLVKANWVDAGTAEKLTQNYRAHREVEHRLQMINDAQTHLLPTTEEGFERLAAFMDMDVEDLRATLLGRLKQTADLTEAFFAPEATEAPQGKASEYLEKWRGFPALRSPRAVEIFERLFPDILTKLDAAADPQEAVQSFERFLSGLPAGVQLFSLFEANQQLTQLIVDICTSSSELAGYLSRNSQVLDAVLGGEFFGPWPGAAGLTQDLSQRLDELDDYEAQLDVARRWQKEWHFRIGVHQLRALILPEEAAAQYADLASAVLQSLYPVVQDQFARKHGAPPGRGAIILAMGSLGAGRLSARSDLDLIVIYDAQGVDASDGKRPLTARAYYARMTQALVTALSAPTAEGKLYEVDMRLRPSGQSGPVATALSSFEAYQSQEAWFWEHMALTRARMIVGNSDIGTAVDAVRTEALTRQRSTSDVARETQEMRQRLIDAGRTGSTWDVKEGEGGVQDIELFAQALALQAHALMRDTAGQLTAAADAGLLAKGEANDLISTHQKFGRVTQAIRLLGGKELDPTMLGTGGQSLILRDLEEQDLHSASDMLAACRKRAKTLIERTLASMLDGDTAKQVTDLDVHDD